MLNTIVKARTTTSIYELMKFDTFYNAQEAVDAGLADKVVERKDA